MSYTGIFFGRQFRSKVRALQDAGSAATRGRCSHGCRLIPGAASFASRSLTVDVGLLALCLGPHTIGPFVQAPQSLPFSLGGRALAFVRALLSFVCHPLAVVRDSLALIGDPISPAGLEFASVEVGLALGESFFALIEPVSPAFQLRGRHDTILGGHQLTLTLSGPPFDPPRATGSRHKAVLPQRGVHIPLFQSPQLPAPVGFHISCAPGAHGGCGGCGGAHAGGGPHGPHPAGAFGPPGPGQSWQRCQSQSKTLGQAGFHGSPGHQCPVGAGAGAARTTVPPARPETDSASPLPTSTLRNRRVHGPARPTVAIS